MRSLWLEIENQKSKIENGPDYTNDRVSHRT
jgi:hypothetical protein